MLDETIKQIEHDKWMAPILFRYMFYRYLEKQAGDNGALNDDLMLLKFALELEDNLYQAISRLKSLSEVNTDDQT